MIAGGSIASVLKVLKMSVFNVKRYYVIVLALIIVLGVVTTSAAQFNNRPVVGILTQEADPDLMQYGNEYIISSYVKFLEMGGASVVAVKGAQPIAYYKDIFQKINGVLFPGGHLDLVKSSVGRSAHILYDMAVTANKNGDYFPILGICQGFEMLTVLTAKKNLLEPADAENISLPLTMLPGYNKSRLFANAPSDIIWYLTNEKVTANFHNMCLPIETFRQQSSLNQFFQALSVNKDRNGKQFVSTMEGIFYPFYGLQWHPEKNTYTIRPDQQVSHSAFAVKITQYIADFLVNEARQNMHGYPSEKDRSRAVIENDKRIFLPKDYVEDFFYNITTKREPRYN